MKKLLLATAFAAAFLSPAQAMTALSETDETTTTGLYYALAYNSVCKPGSLTSDSKQFIAIWLKQIPNTVRESAFAQVEEASTNFGKELFCGMLRKTIEPRLPDINSGAAKFMGMIR